MGDERVLVLMPTARDGERTRAALEAAGVPAAVCPDVAALCREIAAGAGAALLTEEAVVGGGGALQGVLRSQPPWSDFPLVVLAREGAADHAPEIREAMNATLVERPVKIRSLLSVVRAALRARRRQYEVRDHLAGRDRQAEALRASEDRLHVALRAGRMGTWDLDLTTLRMTCSDSCRANYGRGPGEPFTYEDLAAGVHEDDRGRWRAAVDEAVSGSGEFEVEYRTRWPDGTSHWVLVRGSRTTGAGGPALSGVSLDVTDRKLAAQAVQSGQERLRTALAAARMVAWEWTPADRVLRVSENAADVFGLPPGVGLTGIDQGLALVHPDDVEGYKATFRKAIDGRGSYRTQYRLVRPADGRVIWIEEQGHAVSDQPGGEVRLYGVAADVTARREAEDLARAGEEKYRALFETIDEGFCVIEFLDGPHGPLSDYVHVEANPAYATNAGIPDIVGQRVRDMVPDEAAAWVEVYRDVLVTGRPVRFERELVATGRHLDLAAFRVEPPGRRQVAVLFNDVTTRKRAEEELRRLAAELSDSDRRKDDFIALLAHELRNPLAPIRNGLQVLKLAGRGDDRAVAMMDRQLTHMVRLIDDLLDVSRIGRNKMELRRARVPLADVISSAVETAQPAIEAAGHELSVMLPGRPVDLDADLTRLAQVFSNLLTNSAKYTHRGGKVWLTAELHAGAVSVSVRDTGIGIPAESLPTIFDMFSQVDRSIERTTGGLGIGLALVKGLTEMHGGTVTAASGGAGSTFTVTLPVAAARPAAHADAPPAAPAGLTHKILVVDDNRDGADSLSQLLAVLGHQVRTAYDGVEAVEAAREYRPDVILMDVGMPRLNGYEATRQIRAHDWGTGMTIIALTGWGQEGDRSLSKAAGCNGHLVKPVNVADLKRALAEITI